MGVERAVTRWYALQQMFQQEIDLLQGQLEQCQSEDQMVPERAEVERHLEEARARLLALGPCPRPMMG